MKTGDKIICIRTDYLRNKLTLNKIYEIILISQEYQFIEIKCDDNEYGTFDANRFTTLKKLRKQKLLKLKKS